MEQLRAFFEAGLDIKRQGILNPDKLTALQQHNTIDAVATPVEEEPDLSTKAVAADVKRAGTALDAAAKSAKFNAELGTGGATHDQDVAAQIKRCKTVQQLQELFSVEPSLFMEDESTALNTLWLDRKNEIEGQANG
jgi:hypothetical protein